MSKPPKELIEARPGLVLATTVPTKVPLPPRKYSPALHKELVKLIQEGNRPEVAASLVGLSQNEFRAWMKSPNPHLEMFQEDVQAANNRFESSLVQKLVESPDTADTKFLLERRFPAHYSKTSRVVVENELTKAIDMLREGLSQEEYERVVTILAASDSAPAELPPSPYEVTVIPDETE